MPNDTFLQLPSERRKRRQKKKLPAAPRPLQNIGEILRLQREREQRDALGIDGTRMVAAAEQRPEPRHEPCIRSTIQDGDLHNDPQGISVSGPAETKVHSKALECDNQRKFPDLLDDFRKLHARQINDASTIRSAIAVKAVSRRAGCVREFRETVIEIQRSATELLKWCNRNMGSIGAKDREMRRMGIDPYKKNEEDEE